MQVLKDYTALVTGASRGIGVYIVDRLIQEGMNVVLSGASATELHHAASAFNNRGTKILSIAANLEDRDAIKSLVSTVSNEFGAIDVLVNNAGIETFYPYEEVSLDDIERTVRVNLIGTMVLTRLLLPAMLQRGYGHIINMSSLSGKAGPPCCETYAATKAGLIAFTESLRAEFAESGIGFTVICPGFVEAGIYQRVVEQTGLRISRLLGTSSPNTVADAVIHAIKKNPPEIIVNPGPTRLLTTLAELSPALGEKLMRRLGAVEWFKSVGSMRKQKETSASNED